MYDRFLQEVIQGRENHVEERIESIRTLAENMSESGFRTRYELGEKGEGEPVYTESATGWGVVVNIGRNGEIVFSNSAHHRLAMSKLLDIEKIPTVVVVRHQQWEDVRKELRAAGSYEQLGAIAKEHLDHPDVETIVPEDRID
ncbi:MAG: hypothetical protein ACQET5_09790 [Halobacteriota archaeon]|uniref:hypothetical protein n=1 Tax=Natronomonas sp. TaxID=2184060 RepID=UPI00397639BB